MIYHSVIMCVLLGIKTKKVIAGCAKDIYKAEVLTNVDSMHAQIPRYVVLPLYIYERSVYLTYIGEFLFERFFSFKLMKNIY